ncbi:MAG TPA: hypothetical protein DCS93_06390 [Microscillaceae bacterium]|nr:hypothetical protein [Microscillaceae bacterium]
MQTFKPTLPFLLFFFASLTTMAQREWVDKSLTKNKAGKYIFTYKTKMFYYPSKKTYTSKKHWVKTNLIPIGSKVTVTNPKNNKSTLAEVVDTLKYEYEKYNEYIPISPGVSKIYNNIYTYTKASIILTYETPLDSLLSLVPDQSISQQILSYQSLCLEFKKYMLRGYHNSPPVDSLIKIARQLEDEQQASIYSFLALFVQKDAPQKALNYLQKALNIAQQQKDKDKEAQYWVRIGDLRNAMVNKVEFELTYGNDSTLLAQVNNIAQREGYKTSDIIRWSRFGSYFYSFPMAYDTQLYPFDAGEQDWGMVRYYPNVQKFTDKEYLQYLQIKQAQNSTEQVAWILKKLGDLYRITTGYDRAEMYYKKLLGLRLQQKNNDKIAWVWVCLADLYWEQKKFDKAKAYFKKIYNLRKNNNDYRRQIWALGGLRSLSRFQGKLNESLEYQRQIFEVYDLLPQKNRRSVLFFIIDLYRRLHGQRQQAFMQALIDWHQKNYNNPKASKAAIQENNILAREIIILARKLQQYKTAAKYSILNISQQRDTIHQIRLINDVAFYYQKAKEYKLAKKYYQLGSKKAQKLDNKLIQAIQYYKMGYLYDSQAKKKKADKYYQKSLDMFKKIPNSSINTSSSYRGLEYTLYVVNDQEYKQVFSDLLQMAKYFYQTRKDQQKTLAFIDQYIRIIKNIFIEQKLRALKERVLSEKK